jgi:hypothetical protein
MYAAAAQTLVSDLIGVHHSQATATATQIIPYKNCSFLIFLPRSRALACVDHSNCHISWLLLLIIFYILIKTCFHSLAKNSFTVFFIF